MVQSKCVVVLVVEDEAIVRMNTADMLMDLGYEVLEAANADQALVLLARRTDIAVVFTDVNMPGSMDGLKLAKAIRDRWPPIKLIVTSGFMNPKDLDLPAGGRFIPKPYRSDQIKAALQEMTA